MAGYDAVKLEGRRENRKDDRGEVVGRTVNMMVEERVRSIRRSRNGPIEILSGSVSSDGSSCAESVVAI